MLPLIVGGVPKLDTTACPLGHKGSDKLGDVVAGETDPYYTNSYQIPSLKLMRCTTCGVLWGLEKRDAK